MASKYLNKKVEHDGLKFDSKRELSRWLELKRMEQVGAISGLMRQVDYVLAPAVILAGRKKPAMKYRADHVYVRDGRQIVEDVKGHILAMYRIKKHLMMHVHGIEIQEVF